MRDALTDARQWLRYAWEDLREATRLLAQSETVPRHPAWLAQHAAEKALKAVLILENLAFPRTHDLSLLMQYLPATWRVKHIEADLESLTEYAVATRYPGDLADLTFEDAQRAVEEATRIVTAVEADFQGT
jgi:HEPN domain-containing protein